MQRNDRGTLSKLVQVVRPGLHQFPPLFEVGGMVVCRADLVPLLVCQLQLDHVMPVTQLMQHRRGYAPEPVPRHTALVTHPVQGAQDGVIAHGLLMVPLTREKQPTGAAQVVQVAQHDKSLL